MTAPVFTPGRYTGDSCHSWPEIALIAQTIALAPLILALRVASLFRIPNEFFCHLRSYGQPQMQYGVRRACKSAEHGESKWYTALYIAKHVYFDDAGRQCRPHHPANDLDAILTTRVERQNTRREGSGAHTPLIHDTIERARRVRPAALLSATERVHAQPASTLRS